MVSRIRNLLYKWICDVFYTTNASDEERQTKRRLFEQQNTQCEKLTHEKLYGVEVELKEDEKGRMPFPVSWTDEGVEIIWLTEKEYRELAKKRQQQINQELKEAFEGS